MTTRWSLKNPRNYTGGFLTFQLKFSFHIHHFVYGAKLVIIVCDNLFIHFFSEYISPLIHFMNFEIHFMNFENGQVEYRDHPGLCCNGKPHYISNRVLNRK